MERLLIMHLWWNRCEKCHSAYGNHQSATTCTPLTDCFLKYDWSENFRDNLFLQDCCFQCYTREHVCEIYLRNIMPYFIILARVLFSRMPGTREAASLIKPGSQRHRLRVKPNTSTVHTVNYIWHLFTLQMVGQLHIIRPQHKHKMGT